MSIRGPVAAALRLVTRRSGESDDISTRATESEEVTRYRVAAEHAVEQLDWVIRYLHEIRRHKLARALERNRTRIARRLRER